MQHDIKTPIDHHHSNLPIITNTACNKKELDMIGLHFKLAMVSLKCNSVFTDHWNVEVNQFGYEFDVFFKMCCQSLGTEENVFLNLHYLSHFYSHIFLQVDSKKLYIFFVAIYY